MARQANNGADTSSAAILERSPLSHNGGQTSAGGGHTMPQRFFWVALGYLIGLIALFTVYQVSAGFRHALPTSLGRLPIGVPWFGAVGATLLSLMGTSAHRHDWDPRFEGWHYARPWVGGVVGSIGTLILLVVVAAATRNAPTLDHLALYVVAFIVGYREQSFRALIARASDLLLSPGEGPPDSSSGAAAGTTKQKKTAGV